MASVWHDWGKHLCELVLAQMFLEGPCVGLCVALQVCLSSQGLGPRQRRGCGWQGPDQRVVWAMQALYVLEGGLARAPDPPCPVPLGWAASVCVCLCLSVYTRVCLCMYRVCRCVSVCVAVFLSVVSVCVV